ncbi:hypothetical protein U8V72_18150 [Priestia filamentosa]|uniref:hypothetical protein n=1 Tax=Priestia filamentosa TaxID=1402861 RepID=UPI0005895BD7
MRLSIASNKPQMIDFLDKYLNSHLLNQYVEAVVNGIKYEGNISENITFTQKEPYYVMKIRIGEKVEEIPILLDKTRIRIGKTLFYFETERHATVVEIQQ